MKTGNRDPYPFPRLQNDDNFVGVSVTQRKPYQLTTYESQQQEPHARLNRTATLASARREVYHNDPQAPRDSLDFVLKAKYDHHKEFLLAMNETLVQPETLGEDHGRVLKNRVVIQPPEPPALGHPLNEFCVKKKDTIHGKNGQIEGNHGQTTNRGYSRKPDGGFFTS